MEPILERAGYTELTHKTMKVPFGTWPADPKQKEMGAYLYMTAEKGFEAFGLALLTRVLEMDLKEAQELITQAKKESKSRKIHSYSFQ